MEISHLANPTALTPLPSWRPTASPKTRSARIVVSPGYSFLPDSYLLFLTGVTRVNPVEWDLPFSRFTKSVHDGAEIPFEAGTGCLEVARKVLSGRENEMVIETEPGLFEISDEGYVIRYAERSETEYRLSADETSLTEKSALK